MCWGGCGAGGGHGLLVPRRRPEDCADDREFRAVSPCQVRDGRAGGGWSAVEVRAHTDEGHRAAVQALARNLLGHDAVGGEPQVDIHPLFAHPRRMAVDDEAGDRQVIALMERQIMARPRPAAFGQILAPPRLEEHAGVQIARAAVAGDEPVVGRCVRADIVHHVRRSPVQVRVQRPGAGNAAAGRVFPELRHVDVEPRGRVVVAHAEEHIEIGRDRAIGADQALLPQIISRRLAILRIAVLQRKVPVEGRVGHAGDVDRVGIHDSVV